MPLYEYQCEQCGARFEVIQKFSDAPVETCRTCGGPVRRLLSAPAIHFKGTGWYITDYAKKGTEGGDTEKSKGTDKPGSASADTPSTASTSSDSKPATPPTGSTTPPKKD